MEVRSGGSDMGNTERTWKCGSQMDCQVAQAYGKIKKYLLDFKNLWEKMVSFLFGGEKKKIKLLRFQDWET